MRNHTLFESQMTSPRTWPSNIALSMCLATFSATPAIAAMQMSLMAPDGSTSLTITRDSLPITLDLYFNSDGNRVGALEYYLETTPGVSVTYAAYPTVSQTGGSPFIQSELAYAPPAGTTLTSDATSGWIRNYSPENGAAVDYDPFNAPLAQYTFDVSQLQPGQSIDFRPVFLDMLNASDFFETPIDPPGVFTLNVTGIPEPLSIASLSGACLVFGLRRRRSTER